MRPEARGAYNVAAEPVIDPPLLARLAGAPLVPLPAALARAGAAATWRLRLQPSPPGWVDLALGTPLLDTTRIREELGWQPARQADEALLEVLAGMRRRAGEGTAPLAPGTSGPLRIRELQSGVGARDVR
jgi:hypothetical protein